MTMPDQRFEGKDGHKSARRRRAKGKMNEGNWEIEKMMYFDAQSNYITANEVEKFFLICFLHLFY